MVIMSLGYLNSEEIDLFHKQGYVLKSQCIDAVDILKAETEVTSGLLQCSSFLSSFPAPSDKEKEQFANINGSRIVFRNLAGDESSPITISPREWCIGTDAVSRDCSAVGKAAAHVF